MGLSIKSFQQTLKGMVDWTTTNTKKITDFSVGSAVLTLYEAVSSEMEQFYFSMYKNVNWAIENSILDAFNFKRIEAQEAFGYVTLTFYNPLESKLFIPKGTKFATLSSQNGSEVLYYETRGDYIAEKGSVEADVQVYCTTKGTAGNVAADSIKLLVYPINYVQSVTNRFAFLTGKEQEEVSERKQRFNKYISTLARGTKQSIEYGCKEVQGVDGVWVDESEIGVIKCYVHDANGDLPDSLRDQVLANLENYRAAGIPAQVLPISKLLIDISLEVTVLKAYNVDSFKQTLQNRILNFINGLAVSQSFLISDLIQFVMNYDDIAIVNVRVILPTTDVVVPPQHIIRPRDFNLTLITAT